MSHGSGSIDRMNGPARIEVRTSVSPRAWVLRLADALRARGAAVRVIPSAAAGLPATLDWLLQFERIAYRAPAHLFQSAGLASLAGFTGDCDLIVDLAGDAADGSIPVLRMRCADGAGEAGLVAALLSGAPLVLDLVLTRAGETPRVLVNASLAVERPNVLGFALDATLARVTTLLLQATFRIGDSTALRGATTSSTVSPAAPMAFGLRNLATKVADKLTGRLKDEGHWRIATRHTNGDATIDRLAWPTGGWRIVPDDGQRFYADPFLFEHQGRMVLFCEEFPYATGKGILSVCDVAPDGRAGAMRPCLETASHLSWPYVFAHGDDIFMIPESAGANRVELWRAVGFPDRWVLDRVLIENIRLHDPMLHFDSTGAHMIGTLDGDGGSSWDALGLFHAPGLFGPWRADPGNPLLVDASAARPAGPFVMRPDGPWRATQDCRGGYGVALALCRVARLDDGGYAQEVMARLSPPLAGACGVHTLSQVGGIEAIDLRGPYRETVAA